ncbi:MAG: GerMN domain-containing protein [Acidimicrobiia bacterium]|jgi:spore germination protein GerM
MRLSRLLALLAVLLVSCGIPLDAEPETVNVDVDGAPDVPGPFPGDLAAVSLYLVSDETLVRVTRDLPETADLESILASLFAGVTEPEARSNLRSSIPAGTEVIGIESEQNLARIDLSSEFAAVGGEEEILAVAQIVLTATSIDGIDLVAFQLEGVPTDAPVANGALSIEPVEAADYASLVSP